MKKKKIMSIVCAMAMFFTAGCSGNKASESAQQNSAPAAAAESTAEPSGQNIAETDTTEAADTSAETSDSVTKADSPVVYFTSDISAEGLVKIYETLGWTPEGKVAVKISTGEPPASNYLRPELIGDLVKKVNGTIVECNTTYGGSRASSAMHKQVAEDHGFTKVADFDLMDEEGEVEWPMTGGTRLDKVIVGSHAENYTPGNGGVRIIKCSPESQYLCGLQTFMFSR